MWGLPVAGYLSTTEFIFNGIDTGLIGYGNGSILHLLK